MCWADSCVMTQWRTTDARLTHTPVRLTNDDYFPVHLTNDDYFSVRLTHVYYFSRASNCLALVTQNMISQFFVYFCKNLTHDWRNWRTITLFKGKITQSSVKKRLKTSCVIRTPNASPLRQTRVFFSDSRVLACAPWRKYLHGNKTACGAHDNKKIL